MRPLAGSDPSGWVSIQAAGAPRIRIGFRSIEERRRVVDWLNDGLRDGRPGRLAAEYPLLFERNASAIHFTLWEGESPAAFCALWAVTFRVGVHRLRAGMISLVYTDPAFRGRGHASRILETAIEHAVGLELGLILLWSDLDRLYAPLGFDRAGHESLLVLDADTVETALLSERPAPSLEVRPAAPGDWPEIERLRGHRTCQLELDPGDLGRARAIPDLDALVAHDALGVRGFALRGRGDDLGEVVHEWGGDVGAALLCCAAHLSARRAGDSLFLMTPPRRDALAWALRDAGAHRVHQSLAWMRIASPQAFAHDVAAMLPAAQGLQLEPETKTTESPRRFRLRSAHGETVTTQQQVFAALFGRADGSAPSACAGALSPVLDDAARSTLPIPFFVWGLESI
ncbi:MAG: GNAT family N-acetyltransferase [Myxococcota bacterium]